jgi:diketogulonate reductase-like aldo/keto reductase
VFLVSKAYPQNASSSRMKLACERSLKRLGTDYLDLYLLHWRGSVPFAETVGAFEALIREGKIRRWGVSNLDPDDMAELSRAKGGGGCAANQVLYNPEYRGIEFDLLRQSKLPIMAYSPVGQGGGLLKHHSILQVAARHGATAGQIAIAWALRHPNVIAIPKAAREAHVRENAAAAAITLTAQDLAEIDKGFPPPRRATALAML